MGDDPNLGRMRQLARAAGEGEYPSYVRRKYISGTRPAWYDTMIVVVLLPAPTSERWMIKTAPEPVLTAFFFPSHLVSSSFYSSPLPSRSSDPGSQNRLLSPRRTMVRALHFIPIIVSFFLPCSTRVEFIHVPKGWTVQVRKMRLSQNRSMRDQNVLVVMRSHGHIYLAHKSTAFEATGLDNNGRQRFRGGHHCSHVPRE